MFLCLNYSQKHAFLPQKSPFFFQICAPNSGGALTNLISSVAISDVGALFYGHNNANFHLKRIKDTDLL